MCKLLKMSREESTTKKRRLESEASQSSGITFLSYITQTTDPNSDMEDNHSDSSSAVDQTEILYDRGPGTTDTDTIKQMHNCNANIVRRTQFSRMRHVSWSIGDDEVLENRVLRDEVEDNRIQNLIPVPNDDNPFHSRRRVRRVTESNLETNALSFNKPQSPLDCSDQQQCNLQPKPRSYTASQIHGYEHEAQRQRQIDELVRTHDAHGQQRRGRSQSVTCLRYDRLHNRSDSHLYASIHPKNTAHGTVSNSRLMATVVSLSPDESNYLHPVTVTKVQENNFVRLENNSGSSRDERDGCSAYADVLPCNESSTKDQGQTKCYDICDYSAYRKGFYLLLILNVILVVVNIFGIPFVYSKFKQEIFGPHEGITSAVRSEICVDCDTMHEMVKRELSSEMYSDNNKCCVKSAEKILPVFLKIVDSFARVPQTGKSANVPAIQVKADDTRKDKSQTLIVWGTPEINTLEAAVTNTMMEVPKTGYYYVYSRVQYRKPGATEGHEFTIGHTLMKEALEGKDGKQVDSVVQKCFPTHTSGDILHTSQLGSLHHLKQGDRLYIRLESGEYFERRDTLFGMFMVAT